MGQKMALRSVEYQLLPSKIIIQVSKELRLLKQLINRKHVYSSYERCVLCIVYCTEDSIYIQSISNLYCSVHCTLFIQCTSLYDAKLFKSKFWIDFMYIWWLLLPCIVRLPYRNLFNRNMLCGFAKTTRIVIIQYNDPFLNQIKKLFLPAH